MILNIIITVKPKTKIRVFISKIRKQPNGGDHYFWYQVNTGRPWRSIVKGSLKMVSDKREELIEKYKNEYIKIGS